jgi:hypothetical protein
MVTLSTSPSANALPTVGYFTNEASRDQHSIRAVYGGSGELITAVMSKVDEVEEKSDDCLSGEGTAKAKAKAKA